LQILILMGLTFGEFAVEYETAQALSGAILAEVKQWNGGVAWIGRGPTCMVDLLMVWDELVTCKAVQSLNPMQRLGSVPHPVRLLNQVIIAATEAEQSDTWVFLDSTPPGSRVPVHMLRQRGATWKLIDHGDEDGTGVLYPWPPPASTQEQRYHTVQKQATFVESALGQAVAEAQTPVASIDEPNFVVKVPQGTGQDARGGWDVINDLVSADGGQLTECGPNGACFFNSVVLLLGYENSRFRVTVEQASEGAAWNLRLAVIARMRATIGEMMEIFGPTVPYYGEGDTPWLEYLEMLQHPLAWVHGDWEINATAHVISRVISCVQYEDGLLMRLVIGVPERANGGPKLLLARHADHYVAVEKQAIQENAEAQW
jgi:hypothetical protein